MCMVAMVSRASLAQRWELDREGSSLTFKIKNAGLWVNGQFEAFTAQAQMPARQIAEASFSAQIQTASIRTGISARDNHLRNPDYFDADQFPQITFQTSQVRQQPDGQYLAEGQLRIKGTSRAVAIPFTVRWKETSLILSGSLQLNRLDFGVGSKSWILGNEVTIQIEAVFNQV